MNALITDPWNSAKNLVQVTIHVLVLQCNTITYTCKKMHYFPCRKRGLRPAYIPQVWKYNAFGCVSADSVYYQSLGNNNIDARRHGTIFDYVD